MTLITYPTRVHFADGVLEEALYSELDRLKCTRVLAVHDTSVDEHEFADRVWGGLPHRLAVEKMTVDKTSDLHDLVRTTVRGGASFDTIIAFGSARAIELGRKCRYGAMQSTGRRPNLFAVPGIDGLPNPCTRNVESSRAGLPTVLICDPTLVMTADRASSLAATVISFVRCVESYLAQAYNPPADGMALDGLSRCLRTLTRLEQDRDIEVYRELMAAALNASFSQEKGVGPAQTIVAKLGEQAPTGQEAALARLVLPAVVQASIVDSEKAKVLSNVMGEAGSPLAQSLARALSDADSPGSLSRLGVERASLGDAARAVVGSAGLTFAHARDALEAIFEDA